MVTNVDWRHPTVTTEHRNALKCLGTVPVGFVLSQSKLEHSDTL